MEIKTIMEDGNMKDKDSLIRLCGIILQIAGAAKESDSRDNALNTLISACGLAKENLVFSPEDVLYMLESMVGVSPEVRYTGDIYQQVPAWVDKNFRKHEEFLLKERNCQTSARVLYPALGVIEEMGELFHEGFGFPEDSFFVITSKICHHVLKANQGIRGTYDYHINEISGLYEKLIKIYRDGVDLDLPAVFANSIGVINFDKIEDSTTDARVFLEDLRSRTLPGTSFDSDKAVATVSEVLERDWNLKRRQFKLKDNEVRFANALPLALISAITMEQEGDMFVFTVPVGWFVRYVDGNVVTISSYN
jgi:hypothetical protein